MKERTSRNGGKLKAVSIFIEATDYQAMVIRAQNEERTVSSVIRMAIKEYLKQKKGE